VGDVERRGSKPGEAAAFHVTWTERGWWRGIAAAGDVAKAAVFRNIVAVPVAAY